MSSRTCKGPFLPFLFLYSRLCILEISCPPRRLQVLYTTRRKKRSDATSLPVGDRPSRHSDGFQRGGRPCVAFARLSLLNCLKHGVWEVEARWQSSCQGFGLACWVRKRLFSGVPAGPDQRKVAAVFQRRMEREDRANRSGREKKRGEEACQQSVIQEMHRHHKEMPSM